MTQSPENQTPEETALALEIDVEVVKQMMDSDSSLLLIDCRETSEFEYCKIEGAQLIPMNETPHRMTELESHRKSPIVVHCHHGGRSFQVVQFLRSQGFLHAQNMSGGIDVWSQRIDTSVPRY